MTTSTYVKTKEKNFTPINLIPSDLIKCTHCNAYVPHKELQSHIEMHIPAGIRENNLSNNRNIKHTKRVELANVLAGEDYIEGIDVKSFLPDQMPEQQVARKQALKLPEGTNQLVQLAFNTNQYSREISQSESGLGKNPQKILGSNQFSILDFSSENIDKLQFKKVIELTNERVIMKQKKLNYYTNQKPSGLFENKIIVKAKQIQHKEEIQNTEGYQIEPMKKIKKPNNPIRVELNSTIKQVKCRDKISTCSSTGQGFYMPAKHAVHQDQLNVDLQTSNVVNQFQCQQCRGFYCKTCKSDIPPMYRPPVKRLEGQLLDAPNGWKQYLNSGAKQFYTSRDFAKSGGQTSRVTRCTNCE